MSCVLSWMELIIRIICSMIQFVLFKCSILRSMWYYNNNHIFNTRQINEIRINSKFNKMKMKLTWIHTFVSLLVITVLFQTKNSRAIQFFITTENFTRFHDESDGVLNPFTNVYMLMFISFFCSTLSFGIRNYGI